MFQHSRRLKIFQIWSRKWSGRQVEILYYGVERKEYVRNVPYIAHVQTVCSVKCTCRVYGNILSARGKLQFVFSVLVLSLKQDT